MATHSIPPHRRGAYASSRTSRRDAVDAELRNDERSCRGRPSRVVPAPRCRCPATMRLRIVADVTTLPASHGTVTTKPVSPGRTRISRNTIAQGMPAAPAEPVVLPRAFLLHADHGCSPHPAFPAPSVSDEGGSMEKLGRNAPRECDLTPSSAVMPRAGGASSTLRLLGSRTAASGILDRPAKPGDDNGESAES